MKNKNSLKNLNIINQELSNISQGNRKDNESGKYITRLNMLLDNLSLAPAKYEIAFNRQQKQYDKIEKAYRKQKHVGLSIKQIKEFSRQLNLAEADEKLIRGVHENVLNEDRLNKLFTDLQNKGIGDSFAQEATYLMAYSNPVLGDVLRLIRLLRGHLSDNNATHYIGADKLSQLDEAVTKIELQIAHSLVQRLRINSNNQDFTEDNLYMGSLSYLAKQSNKQISNHLDNYNHHSFDEAQFCKFLSYIESMREMQSDSSLARELNKFTIDELVWFTEKNPQFGKENLWDTTIQGFLPGISGVKHQVLDYPGEADAEKLKRYELQLEFIRHFLSWQNSLEQINLLFEKLDKGENKELFTVKLDEQFFKAQTAVDAIRSLCDLNHPGALSFKQNTKTYLAGIAKKTVGLQTVLEQKYQVYNSHFVEENSKERTNEQAEYLQFVQLSPMRVKVKGQSIQLVQRGHEDIPHGWSPVAGARNDYFIKTATSNAWQTINQLLSQLVNPTQIKLSIGFDIFDTALNKNIVASGKDLEAISNYNPYNPYNLIAEINDEQAYFFKLFAKADHEVVVHYLDRTLPELEENIEAQNKRLQEYMAKSYASKLPWNLGFYVKEKKRIHELKRQKNHIKHALTEVASQQLNKHSEIGHLPEHIAARFAKQIKEHGNFATFNLNREQTVIVKACIEKEKNALIKNRRSWVTRLFMGDKKEYKQGMRDIKALERDINQQQRANAKIIQLVVDTPYALNFLRKVNKGLADLNKKSADMQRIYLADLKQHLEIADKDLSLEKFAEKVSDGFENATLEAENIKPIISNRLQQLALGNQAKTHTILLNPSHIRTILEWFSQQEKNDAGIYQLFIETYQAQAENFNEEQKLNFELANSLYQPKQGEALDVKRAKRHAFITWLCSNTTGLNQFVKILTQQKESLIARPKTKLAETDRMALVQVVKLINYTENLLRVLPKDVVVSKPSAIEGLVNKFKQYLFDKINHEKDKLEQYTAGNLLDYLMHDNSLMSNFVEFAKIFVDGIDSDNKTYPAHKFIDSDIIRYQIRWLEKVQLIVKQEQENFRVLPASNDTTVSVNVPNYSWEAYKSKSSLVFEQLAYALQHQGINEYNISNLLSLLNQAQGQAEQLLFLLNDDPQAAHHNSLDFFRKLMGLETTNAEQLKNSIKKYQLGLNIFKKVLEGDMTSSLELTTEALIGKGSKFTGIEVVNYMIPQSGQTKDGYSCLLACARSLLQASVLHSLPNPKQRQQVLHWRTFLSENGITNFAYTKHATKACINIIKYFDNEQIKIKPAVDATLIQYEALKEATDLLTKAALEGQFIQSIPEERVLKDIILVGLDDEQNTALQKKAEAYAQKYRGEGLRLARLMTNIGNEKAIEVYATSYLTLLFHSQNKNGIKLTTDIEAELIHFLAKNESTATILNQVVKEFIAQPVLKWHQNTQELLVKLPGLNSENKQAYANLRLKELLSVYVVKYLADNNNIDPSSRIKHFIEKVAPHAYSLPSSMADAQQNGLIKLFENYIATNPAFYGNEFDDKLAAALLGHNTTILRDLRIRGLERLLQNMTSQHLSASRVLEAFEGFKATISSNKPSSLLPKEPSNADVQALKNMLTKFYKQNAPWNSAIDQMFCDKTVYKINPAAYRLMGLRQLLAEKVISENANDRFIEYFSELNKAQTPYANLGFNAAEQQELQKLLQQNLAKGWDLELDKLIQAFGTAETKDLCMVSLFDKMLNICKNSGSIDYLLGYVCFLLKQRGKADETPSSLNKNTLLFETQVGNEAIEKVINEYISWYLTTKPVVAEGQTGFNSKAQQILWIIDRQGHASKLLAVARFMELAKGEQTTVQEVLAYAESLVSQGITLEAQTVTPFINPDSTDTDCYSFDELLMDELGKLGKVWHQRLFRIADLYASAKTQDSYVLHHTRLALAFTQTAELKKHLQQISEGDQQADSMGYNRLRTDADKKAWISLLQHNMVKRAHNYFTSGQTDKNYEFAQRYNEYANFNLIINDYLSQQDDLKNSFITSNAVNFMDWLAKDASLAEVEQFIAKQAQPLCNVMQKMANNLIKPNLDASLEDIILGELVNKGWNEKLDKLAKWSNSESCLIKLCAAKLEYLFNHLGLDPVQVVAQVADIVAIAKQLRGDVASESEADNIQHMIKLIKEKGFDKTVKGQLDAIYQNHKQNYNLVNYAARDEHYLNDYHPTLEYLAEKFAEFFDNKEESHYAAHALRMSRLRYFLLKGNDNLVHDTAITAFDLVRYVPVTDEHKNENLLTAISRYKNNGAINVQQFVTDYVTQVFPDAEIAKNIISTTDQLNYVLNILPLTQDLKQYFAANSMPSVHLAEDLVYQTAQYICSENYLSFLTRDLETFAEQERQSWAERAKELQNDRNLTVNNINKRKESINNAALRFTSFYQEKGLEDLVEAFKHNLELASHNLELASHNLELARHNLKQGYGVADYVCELENLISQTLMFVQAHLEHNQFDAQKVFKGDNTTPDLYQSRADDFKLYLDMQRAKTEFQDAFIQALQLIIKSYAEIMVKEENTGLGAQFLMLQTLEQALHNAVRLNELYQQLLVLDENKLPVWRFTVEELSQLSLILDLTRRTALIDKFQALQAKYANLNCISKPCEFFLELLQGKKSLADYEVNAQKNLAEKIQLTQVTAQLQEKLEAGQAIDSNLLNKYSKNLELGNLVALLRSYKDTGPLLPVQSEFLLPRLIKDLDEEAAEFKHAVQSAKRNSHGTTNGSKFLSRQTSSSFSDKKSQRYASLAAYNSFIELMNGLEPVSKKDFKEISLEKINNAMAIFAKNKGKQTAMLAVVQAKLEAILNENHLDLEQIIRYLAPLIKVLGNERQKQKLHNFIEKLLNENAQIGVNEVNLKFVETYGNREQAQRLAQRLVGCLEKLPDMINSTTFNFIENQVRAATERVTAIQVKHGEAYLANLNEAELKAYKLDLAMLKLNSQLVETLLYRVKHDFIKGSAFIQKHGDIHAKNTLKLMLVITELVNAKIEPQRFKLELYKLKDGIEQLKNLNQIGVLFKDIMFRLYDVKLESVSSEPKYEFVKAAFANCLTVEQVETKSNNFIDVLKQLSPKKNDKSKDSGLSEAEIATLLDNLLQTLGDKDCLLALKEAHLVKLRERYLQVQLYGSTEQAQCLDKALEKLKSQVDKSTVGNISNARKKLYEAIGGEAMIGKSCTFFKSNGSSGLEYAYSSDRSMPRDETRSGNGSVKFSK